MAYSLVVFHYMNDKDDQKQAHVLISEKFLKPYNPAETESRIYDMCENTGYFNPDKLPSDKPGRGANGEPFSIVLPPPNVTGVLHMGSALMLAIEDIIVRYARMTGKKTMWIPGTDHAAIATQSVVEKDIQKKEGKSRYDLGRPELLKRIEQHVETTHDIMVSQMRKMGASLDWSREAFTLDAKRNVAVRTAFKKMFDDGLIYRGFRVVNWDPKGQTTISDDEIVYETRKAKLYTFKYSKDIPISISTTRPETKLGDTAIAVHPEDERYKAYIGKEYDAEFAGEKIHIKVIADQSVEKEFGTGALGVTPAHSNIDWEIAQRHGLPLKQVINEYAKMTVGMEGVKDKKTAEAREAVVMWLKEQGLLEKEEDVEQNISTAERTGGIVEPLPKLQWFVAVNKEFDHVTAGRNGQKKVRTTLKQLMIDAVSKQGAEGPEKINIIPDRFEKVYFNWINNLRDWCVSRQIWYGHQIPVWYKGEEVYVGVEAPAGEGWKQDEDTLDTWFSSGLWTFSTLGWPDEKEFSAQRAFHPTTILETGSDILFFWVARMILMSTYLLGEIPFKTVYLHGLVRDGKGRKISKSLGNNIDPVDMIIKYGADSVRMALIVAVGPGNDSKVDEQKVKAYKLFSNKIWNITRFILSAAAGERYGKGSVPKIKFDAQIFNDQLSINKLGTAEQAYLKQLNDLITEITKEMDEYKFYLVGEKLYHYVWHELADKILEESKPILNGEDIDARTARVQFLLYALRTTIKALHPFMPYVTEEIWQDINSSQTMLIVEEWPQVL